MKEQLWLRLKDYHFDQLVPAHLADHVTAMFGGADASTRAFASKLARKLGWTPSFALRAIGEYRKFVYLGVIADFSVTPPKVIDQVWHEHLLFSRAYREFCRDVIRRDFDHNPELVPTPDQTDVFQAQFLATLALYQTEFDTAPPADIWGTPKFRAGAGDLPVQAPRKRDADASSAAYDEAPLHQFFDGASGAGHSHGHGGMPEFGGGGGFFGGGGGSDWGGHAAGHGDSAGAGHGGDAGGADAGGSACSGGSGCSSSCGGGGCGSD